MRVSFVATVFDEEKTISKLLDSLLAQSLKPDEIIIVDGGSSDETTDILKNYQVRSKLRYFTLPGANRARGRNEAIEKAGGEIIAISDAGCELDENWLKNIAKPFEDPGVDVVAGFYQPVIKNVFQKCLACYTSVMPDRVDPKNFLPSSRSIAFKKSAWQEVSGYTENLNYCEDLVFAQKLRDHGFKFHFVPQALVFWPQRENLSQAFRQFSNYAFGDAQAWYCPHLKKISLVYLRYLIGAVILFLGFVYDISIYRILAGGVIFAYFIWAIGKNFRYIKHPAAFLYLPLLQVTADLAVMAGFARGVLK